MPEASGTGARRKKRPLPLGWPALKKSDAVMSSFTVALFLDPSLKNG